MRILNTGEDSLNENNRFPIINQLLTILKLTAKILQIQNFLIIFLKV